MPLFITPGHKFSKQTWFYDNQSARLADEPGIIAQLQRLQTTRKVPTTRLKLEASGGVLRAKHGLAIGYFGRPKYLEYQILNEDGSVGLFLNGLTLYEVSKSSKVTSLFTSESVSIPAGGYFTAGGATLSLQHESLTLDGEWHEGNGPDDRAYGIVSTGKSLERRPLYFIQGLSKNEQLQGRKWCFQITANEQPLAEMYPEGEWSFSPTQAYERYLQNTVSVLRYSPALTEYVSKSPENAFGLSMALAVGFMLAHPMELPT